MEQTQSSTVKEIRALCDKVLTQRQLTEEAEEIYKKLNKECDDLEQALILLLQAEGFKDFREAGKLFLVTKKSTVSTPKDENKDVFFNYLKEIGHFDALATVHSKTLNSWYNQEKEAAALRGEPIFSVPGLEMPVERVGLTIRQSKI
jgi:thioredoxin-like negative regulator of GroEL